MGLLSRLKLLYTELTDVKWKSSLRLKVKREIRNGSYQISSELLTAN